MSLPIGIMYSKYGQRGKQNAIAKDFGTKIDMDIWFLQNEKYNLDTSFQFRLSCFLRLWIVASVQTILPMLPQNEFCYFASFPSDT